MKGLDEIKKTIESLDYKCERIKKGADSPTDMLLVSIEDMEEQFAISILPLSDDLEGSLFIQFYYEYPFILNTDAKDNLAQELYNVNRQLPLGHFNITIGGNQIYYKYVLAHADSAKASTENFSDIIDMLIFAITHFKDGFTTFEALEEAD